MAQTKSKSSSSNTSNKSPKSSSGSNSSTKKLKSSSQQDQSGLLEELFIDELKDIYWAEKHLTKALPKMEKAATSAELKQSFSDHLKVTKEHVTRLERAFEMLGKKAQAKKCEAMDGLTKEGESIIEDTDGGTLTRDVGLIMAAQKVEHYEIATYGSLAQLAKTLGKNDIAELMMQTLGEEKEADELLTSIAENNINVEASAE
ncbi:MAG: ferritin-like domain-containing protein [Bacteroidota bacterium]|nr:ferritin-like domain-containing protein [Bacteroidota bacterium]